MKTKFHFNKGDRVETPCGVGEIVSDIGICGDCLVKLDTPLVGGDSDGQQEIKANTFQMRHEKCG